MTKAKIIDELAGQLANALMEGSYPTWTDLNLVVHLSAPYPSGYILSVWGELDEDDEEPYFCVYVLTADRTELWHVESSGNDPVTLSSAVSAALDRFSDEPDCWDDASVESAYEVLCDLSFDADGRLEDSFLHFAAGTSIDHIHDWFDRHYSLGIKYLLNPSSDKEYPGMGANELKSAVCALIDAYVELAEHYRCTHGRIADSLSDIFDDEQLTWLGYPEYTAEHFFDDDDKDLEPSVEDLMVADLLDDDRVDGNHMTAPVSNQGNTAGEPLDIDLALFDTIDPDGRCLSCNYLRHFATGTGKCKNCLNHGGTEDNYDGESSCEEVYGPCFECRKCDNWHTMPSFKRVLEAFVDETLRGYFNHDGLANVVCLPDGTIRYEVAPRFDDELTSDEINSILTAENAVAKITELVGPRYAKDIAARSQKLEDYVMFEVHKVHFGIGNVIPEESRTEVREQLRRRFSFTVPVSYYMAIAAGKPWFNVGDKVRVQYHSERNPHNGMIGTISWLHDHKFYPGGDTTNPVIQTQVQILYPDGTAEMLDNIYRAGSGTFSPVEKIQKEA